MNGEEHVWCTTGTTPNDAIIMKLHRRHKDQIEKCVKAFHTKLTTQALNALAMTNQQQFCVNVSNDDDILLNFLNWFPEETRAELNHVFEGFRLLLGYHKENTYKHCWILMWDPTDLVVPPTMDAKMIVDFPSWIFHHE